MKYAKISLRTPSTGTSALSLLPLFWLCGLTSSCKSQINLLNYNLVQKFIPRGCLLCATAVNCIPSLCWELFANTCIPHVNYRFLIVHPGNDGHAFHCHFVHGFSCPSWLHSSLVMEMLFLFTQCSRNGS